MAYNSSQNEAILKFLVNSPFTLFSAMFHSVTSSPMILHDKAVDTPTQAISTLRSSSSPLQNPKPGKADLGESK
jgi:hypothetical protein